MQVIVHWYLYRWPLLSLCWHRKKKKTSRNSVCSTGRTKQSAEKKCNKSLGPAWTGKCDVLLRSLNLWVWRLGGKNVFSLLFMSFTETNRYMLFLKLWDDPMAGMVLLLLVIGEDLYFRGAQFQWNFFLLLETLLILATGWPAVIKVAYLETLKTSFYFCFISQLNMHERQLNTEKGSFS